MAKKTVRLNAAQKKGLEKGRKIVAAKRAKARAAGKTPKYIRNTRKPWGKEDVRELKQLIKENTPTRVIGLKLGRTVASVRDMARDEGLSLKPTNQSPNKGRAKKKA
jgi:hypothetical protein